MKQSIINISLVVRDYDEAIEFFTQKLHFIVVEDSEEKERNKRWVVITPAGSNGTRIVLGKASNLKQKKCIGNQTGGRVFLSLETNNFTKDYKEMLANGIQFVRKPKDEEYGKVAVFKDLYGNLWDLIQYYK